MEVKALVALFLIAAVLATEVEDAERVISCPALKCSDEDNSYCITRDGDEVTHWECESDTYCPPGNIYKLKDTACVDGEQEDIPELDCFDYQDEEEECSDPFNIFDPENAKPCEFESYCDFESMTCKKRIPAGETCSITSFCEYGYTCHESVCIEIFSLEDGEPTSNPFACQSGYLKRGKCGSTSQTVGELPKACTKHSDCTATDGAPGWCLCSYGEDANSYCSIHASDEPIIEGMRALKEGYLEFVYAILKWIKYYPAVLETPECYWEDLRQSREVVAAIERLDECYDLDKRSLSTGLFEKSLKNLSYKH